MKKFILGLVGVIVLIALAMTLPSVRTFLIAANLPDYPDWPAPTTQLTGTENGKIYYASSSPYDLEVILGDMNLARPTTGLGYISYPATASADVPVPAMVIMPGSGGIAPGREHEYAAWLNAHGVAAFIVEYYEPRGFGKDSNYLIRTSSVTEFDLIADSYAALILLGTSPIIDPTQIGIIGFSYGGMAARLSMDPRIHRALAPNSPPFSLHIDNYGPCFQNLQSSEASGAPLLTLRGTEDASNDLKACKVREDELRALGVEVTANIYQGVGHAWENSETRYFSKDSPYLLGCEVSYDKAGRAFLDGELIADYPLNASHARKMAARLSMATRFQDCVGWGYYVGRDENARTRGYADILAFLANYWGIQ
jgi:dienelactone hydrolase